MTNILSIVNELRNLKLSVIPSGRGKEGKSPDLNSWKPYQTNLPTDAAHNHWCSKLKPSLWGIVTGEVSGVVVVDGDSAAAIRRMGDLKPHVRTPRGGGHYYFKYPGHYVKTVAGILPKIDIRADGGFANIIGANPVTGGEYHIETMPTPEVIYPWDQMPKAILEKMNSSKQEPALEAKPSTPIPEGQRNSTLTSLAGTMQRRGMPLEAIQAALLEVNRLRCYPPLPENEVHGIARNVAKYEPAQNGEKDKRRLTVATQLLELAKDIELFHTPDRMPYVVIKQGGHTEVWPLESRTVKDYLARCYYGKTGSAPSSQAIQNAFNVLRGHALFEGLEKPVYTRIAECDGKIYLDLCNFDWSVVEITTQGWQVIQSSPIYFVRSRGMTSLPAPQASGDVYALRDLLNVASADWSLLLGWLIGALMPSGPYPVLVLTGEQGSAKSTVARMIRSLVDPSTIPLRSLPREERDLAISAGNSWIIAFDNVSYLMPWLSDAICRLTTGGGFATRELYVNAEEVLFTATRPVILNGIGDIATRSDLLDRAIIIALPTIPNDKRRTEADLREEFELVRPMFLALLLDAVSLALRNVDTVELDDMPRMADFTKWVVAAIPALGVAPSDFLDAYGGNIQDINELALESTPAARAIMILASEIPDGDEWIGTATELLDKLSFNVGETAERRKDWPKGARALGAILRRLAPNFRAVGIDIMWDRGGGERLIYIRKGTQKYITPAKPRKVNLITKTGKQIHINMTR